jgi:hypothetical protein
VPPAGCGKRPEAAFFSNLLVRAVVIDVDAVHDVSMTHHVDDERWRDVAGAC